MNCGEYIENIDIAIKKLQELRKRVSEIGDGNDLEAVMGLRFQIEPVRWAMERLGYFPGYYVENYRKPVEAFQARYAEHRTLMHEPGDTIEAARATYDAYMARQEAMLELLKIVPCEEKDYHPDRGTITYAGGKRVVTPPTKRWKG